MFGLSRGSWVRPVTTAMAAVILTATAASGAEPPVVPVTPDHYTGTWYEIGRRPMWLTDGCVAGYTTYSRGLSAGRVLVEDGCRMGSPRGELKTIKGIGTIKDPDDARAKLRVRYRFLITFDYWVLYKSPDKSWFISADPEMKNLWIYARHAPSQKLLARMKAKVTELGYDLGKLEFPEPAR